MSSTCRFCGVAYEHGGSYCRSRACLSEMKRQARAARPAPAPAPRQVVYVEVAGVRYLRGIGSVALHLGVTTRQADAWHRRRHRNGFPSGLRLSEVGNNALAWDPEAVSDWRAGYEPSRGGAPRGERNSQWRGGTRRRLDEDGTRRRAS